MTPTCTHCKGPITTSGRRSEKLGNRYCMARACQAAKQRAYRASVRIEQGDTPVKEVRPCSGCSMALPHRPGRITDNPAGRWCTKRTCQRDRHVRLAIMEKLAAGDVTRAEMLQVNGLFWAAMRRELHDCPVCHLPRNPAGFKHPTAEGLPCTGLADFPVREDDLRHAFPERIPAYLREQ